MVMTMVPEGDDRGGGWMRRMRVLCWGRGVYLYYETGRFISLYISLMSRFRIFPVTVRGSS